MFYFFGLWLAFIFVFILGYRFGRNFQYKHSVKVAEYIKTNAYYQGLQKGKLEAQFELLGYTKDNKSN